MGAVDVRFAEVELAAISEVGRETSEHSLQHAVLDPRLESSMARRRWRVAPGQVRPGGPGAQDPEHAIDDITWVSPRPAALLRRALPLAPGEAAFDRVPLLVGEVHPHL